MKKALAVATILFLLAVTSFAQSGADRGSRGYGVFNAANYNYGVIQSIPPLKVSVGNTGTGSQTYTVSSPAVTLPDGRVIFPLSVTAPITIDVGSNSETVTPTAVSGCNNLSSVCTITASFSNAHGQGAPIYSGTQGLQEAINDAFSFGGGEVVVDNSGFVTNTLLAAAVPYHSVSIRDSRNGVVQNWNISPNSLSFLAVPATLTAVTALPSATPVGAYGTGTYHLAIAYVDAMGNEGPASLDFSEAGLATGSFIFSPPAASAGAVGYTIYISLTSGTYALAYKVPLTAAICGGSLTKIETVVAACPVTNATYGQTGATATVTAITVATAPLAAQLGAASTTSDYVANSNAHTAYAYAPGNRIAIPGVVSASVPFTVTTAAATTVPAVIGTVTLPAGFMNFIGRTIRVCGFAKEASAGSTSTITTIQFFWDAPGSNTTGVGVNLGGPTITGTLVTSNADQWEFCQDLKTTVAGAGATAGSIALGVGHLSASYGAATTVSAAAGPTIGAAAVGSLNLAGEARLNVIYLHTTGTDGAGVILQDLTVEVLN